MIQPLSGGVVLMLTHIIELFVSNVVLSFSSLQRKFREADEEDSYFNEDDDDVVATAEVEMGANDANTGVTADFAAAAPPDEKGSTTEDVASLMEDVKTLDQ